jgi:predicted peroxiredoxin
MVFNIAMAAAATDQEVAIFFTYEGLNLIHKEANGKLPLPEGKELFAEGFKRANVSRVSYYGTGNGRQVYWVSNDHGRNGLGKRSFR